MRINTFQQVSNTEFVTLIKTIDVTGISTVSFDVSVSDPINSYKISLNQMLFDIFHTNS
jgi:hypothetical protein